MPWKIMMGVGGQMALLLQVANVKKMTIILYFYNAAWDFYLKGFFVVVICFPMEIGYINNYISLYLTLIEVSNICVM